MNPPCIPCSMPCLECSQSCGQTVSQILNIHLTRLDLEYPQNVTLMEVHHLTVKLITGILCETILAAVYFPLDFEVL